VIVLVTGATDGIGKQTAVDLAARGAHVIVHGRKKDRVERVKNEVKGSGVVADLGSLAHVPSLAKEVLVAHPKIDVLINNAGVFMNERIVTEDGFEATFHINHLAPFLLTHLLLGSVAHVINVSSIAHTRGHIDFDDLQAEKHFDGYDAYAQSKLANVFFTRELARRHPEIKTNSLHPGVVGTKLLREGFGGMGGSDSLEEGAATSVYLATTPSIGTGGYYVRSKLTEPSKEARDPAIAKRLFDVSLRLIE